MLRIFSFSLILTLALFSLNSRAEGPNTNPLTATARLQPSTLMPGQTASVLFELDLANGFHAYADKFKIAVESKEDLKIDDLKLSPIVKFYDNTSKKNRDGVEKKPKATAILEVPIGTKPGSYDAQLKLSYQACSQDYCLFPKTLTIPVHYVVTGAAGASAPTNENGATMAAGAPATSGSKIESSFNRAMGQSLFLAILVVFGMGVITSLTPCIYPMIPITLAVLGARTKGQSQLKSFSLSIAYVLGIAFTYSILGVVAAKTGALFGSALGNIYVVTAIALLFVVMALSMYGLFELQVPAFIRNRVGTAQTGPGYVGAFVTGLIAGIVASPCVGPVLVGVLTYIAETQNTVVGFVLLFSFACGLGLLFIVLGTFSSLLNRMPKAGAWMDATKFIFGTIMIAAALYYVKPVYPSWLFHLLIGIAVLMITSSYGAFEPNATLMTPGSRLRKGLMMAAFFVGVLFAAAGALEVAGIPIPFSNISSAAKPADVVKLKWQPYSDAALASALAAKKPVLIDFFADWCGACVEMEHDTFPDSRIQAESAKFALFQIDATNDSPLLDTLKKKYAVLGLPTMIFYDTRGALRADQTVTGFEDADTFLKHMAAVQP